MDRSNHYEAAFEAYLRARRLGYVAVDEAHRSTLDDEPVKSLDFIVHGADGSKLLVDVKGRRFPTGALPRLFSDRAQAHRARSDDRVGQGRRIIRTGHRAVQVNLAKSGRNIIRDQLFGALHGNGCRLGAPGIRSQMISAEQYAFHRQ